MKILMVDYALPGNKYADGLAVELSKKTDFKMAVEARYISEMNKNYTNVPVLYNGGRKGIMALISYGISLLKLSSMIIFGRYDIVHVQTFKIPRVEVTMYRFLKILMHGKLVHTAHNVNPHEQEIASNDVFGNFYCLCDGLFVHNEYSKKILCEQYNIPQEKIKVIAHGVYKNPDAKYNDRLSESSEKHIFLFFGQLRRYKGIDILLRAISKLPESKRREMKFVIAGRHHKLDTTDYAGMIKELGIGNYVELRDEFIPDKDMVEYFITSDACICPYREIYGSGVLLEAYTYRCPVIVSDFPVFVEETQGGRTGLLFETGNENDLARAIIEFVSLSRDEKMKFKRNISELVERKYNWEKSSADTIAGYEDFLKR